ncbi:MAG: DUF2807 domain-containing protein [Flavobacteriaceae bacterium]|nr:DUF2807 domain-containing protein [Flavobacteriaceae bacterium]
MRTILKTLILLLVFISTTSCIFGGFGIKGNRNVVSENRKISSDFEAIKVSQGITVHLTQDNHVDLSIEADENIIDLLVTEVEGGVLKIYFEKKVSRAKAKNVYLTAKKISNIKTSSGACVKTMNTLKIKSITLKSSSGSRIEAKLDTQKVDCSTSSGSNTNLSGTTVFFEGSSSSGSHIDARDLESKIGNVKVSSGAGISVDVKDELTARASSGGNIHYSGNPQVVNKSKSSGGSISKK